MNYDTENLWEFLNAYTMEMDKIIDNVVPTKKAEVHTRKVCQTWHNNILRDQKTKVHRREMIWQKYKENHQWLAFQMERFKTSECLVQLGNSFTAINSKT